MCANVVCIAFYLKEIFNHEIYYEEANRIFRCHFNVSICIL